MICCITWSSSCSVGEVDGRSFSSSSSSGTSVTSLESSQISFSSSRIWIYFFGGYPTPGVYSVILLATSGFVPKDREW